MVEKKCINCINFRVEADTKLQKENEECNREIVKRAMIARFGVTDPTQLKAFDDEICHYARPSVVGYKYCEGEPSLVQSNDNCTNTEQFYPRN